ncbi:DedA family protein [Ureibacillus acetophenoni]|uniref:Membrane protein DedA with SNARE-associated domain n=1 Tax=Ureibacillus acetophenoni TaxID=614649 RepID=A0A285UJ16_9BACL|nr:DedA family protein [Ureibacillus acetophenoni]SOC41895.1 membrane protein DedA with SNARE-associated domain [Ureibacillus acetophenoni]
MESWITNIMEDFGYIGVFLLIMLENIFPPIPSEVILTFGGYMTTQSDLTIVGVVIASTLGSVAGAIALYDIGRIVGIKRIGRFVDKWGRFLRLTNEDIYKANDWFKKYGVWTVFFCRFVPLIRSLISLPAGMSKMNFWLFLVLTTVGTFIWNIVLITLGSKVGENWDAIVAYMDTYSNIAYALIALIGIVFFIWLFRRKANRK